MPLKKKTNKPLAVMAILGARSGSKGVPHKNIKPLAGKPLIAWIIGAVKKSRFVNRIIVSTDSPEYQRIARTCGAEAPFLRPPELATDRAPEFEYIKHALAWLKEHEGYAPDIVVRVMATVPLQRTEDIDAVIEKLIQDPTASGAVVVAPARQHPEKALKLIPDGTGGDYLVTYRTGSGREVTPLARQSYEKAYFRANVIACPLATINETHSLTGDRVRAHCIPEERAVDIDSELDFFITEQLITRFGSDDTALR